jgi:hypothetical protein
MMKSYNIFHCLRILLLIIISYPAVTEAADIVSKEEIAKLKAAGKYAGER